MSDTVTKKISIKDSFIYKHGFSLVLGLLAILSVLVTSSVIITQKTSTVQSMRKNNLEHHIDEYNVELNALRFKLDELTRRVNKLERRK
jgi:hypothetical protein